MKSKRDNVATCSDCCLSSIELQQFNFQEKIHAKISSEIVEKNTSKKNKLFRKSRNWIKRKNITNHNDIRGHKIWRCVMCRVVDVHCTLYNVHQTNSGYAIYIAFERTKHWRIWWMIWYVLTMATKIPCWCPTVQIKFNLIMAKNTETHRPRSWQRPKCICLCLFFLYTKRGRTPDANKRGWTTGATSIYILDRNFNLHFHVSRYYLYSNFYNKWNSPFAFAYGHWMCTVHTHTRTYTHTSAVGSHKHVVAFLRGSKNFLLQMQCEMCLVLYSVMPFINLLLDLFGHLMFIFVVVVCIVFMDTITWFRITCARSNVDEIIFLSFIFCWSRCDGTCITCRYIKQNINHHYPYIGNIIWWFSTVYAFQHSQWSNNQIDSGQICRVSRLYC